MKDISLTFQRRAGEGGTLFGSVTSMDIADALKAEGYEIDRRKIVLKDAIKETGDFTVNVKLHREITLAVPVKVTAEVDADKVKTKKSADSVSVENEMLEDTTEKTASSAETSVFCR